MQRLPYAGLGDEQLSKLRGVYPEGYNYFLKNTQTGAG